jgi:hypothetical protein
MQILNKSLIMSILDIDEIMPNLDKLLKVEKIIAAVLLRYGGVKCVVSKGDLDIKNSIINRFSEVQKEHKERDYLSLDCRGLRKGDACGWLKAISEGIKNGTLNKPILVIENVDQIPDGDRNIYDDPLYVENILVRSWKNELINISDFYIDRRELTVILTCSPENQTLLGNACRICSYAWLGEFEEWYNRIKNI